MSVTDVSLQYAGLSGSATLTGQREYVKIFTVIMDSTADGVMTVGNAAGLPRKGDTYSYEGETDPGALCWQVDPQRNSENNFVWTVVCKFSNNLGGAGGEKSLLGDPRFDVDNPLLKPPIPHWSHWEETEVVLKDVLDEPILNACGLPFDPPVVRVRKQRTLVVVRNEPVYPDAIDRAYAGALNSDAFFGYGPLQARLEDISGEQHFESGTRYWQIRYEIRFRLPNWNVKVANAGTRHFKRDGEFNFQLNDDGTIKLFAIEDDGIFSTNTVFLTAEGLRMSQDDVLNGQAIYYEFQLDKAKPFSALNL